MTDIVGELKTGRVVVRPVQVTEREKTKTEYQLILDGHVLGQSKGVTDALFHGYALETALAGTTKPPQGQPEKESGR